MEVIKLRALDTAQQLPPVQMLPRAKTHGERIVRGHLIRQLLRDVRAVLLLLLGLRVDIPVDELPQSLLQPPMAIVVVGARVRRGQPEGLGIGDLAQIAGLGIDDLGLLALDRADAQRRVLLQHLVSVEVVERARRIRPRDLLQHDVASRMRVQEIRQVVHLVVDDAP